MGKKGREWGIVGKKGGEWGDSGEIFSTAVTKFVSFLSLERDLSNDVFRSKIW